MSLKCVIPSLLLSTLLAAPLTGQAFNSGSNGSYGPLNITADTTLPMPADGIFHCTTITIAAGRTLSFSKNPLNTPVYLLASGDVTIGGIISVNHSGPVDGTGNLVGGSGGPGGFDGGASGHFGGVANRAAGSGQGPGGGKRGTSGSDVGCGSYATARFSSPRAADGGTYGSSLLLPLIGGSGGGGLDGINGGFGGGGGGAVLVSSSTRITMSGSIQAIGSPGGNTFNGGSGGAIRLVSPRVFGGGSVIANNQNGQTYAGNGHIRIDSLLKVDPLNTAQFLNLSYNGNVTVGSNMLVFPPPIRLDVLEAAGTTITEGTAAPVYVALPYGANPAQTVKVQARGFGGVVPIRVALIPESGSSITYDASIDNTTTNPALATINVVMPVNVKVHVQVWTR